jgi:protein O-GlcNAc transferase
LLAKVSLQLATNHFVMTAPETLNLAMQRHRAGNLAEAEALYRRVLDQFPNEPEGVHLHAQYNLGVLHESRQDFPSAIASYQRALALQPDFVQALNNLGVAYCRVGQWDQAIAHLRRVAALRPDLAGAHHNLAAAFSLQGDRANAIACLEKVLALAPDHPSAHADLGNVLFSDGQFDACAVVLSQTMTLRPEDPLPPNNLGGTLLALGLIDQAIASYERASALAPADAAIASNRIFALHFHPDSDSAALLAAEQDWDRRFAERPRPLVRPHVNPGAPGSDRRLRIGYLSPDFREHVVGWNMLPLLGAHNREQFEIIGYANVPRPDGVTERLGALADTWRNIHGWSDDHAADLIRSDGIDILVDLALHSAGNRLLIFARKPAPVQVSYLGYAGGTGLWAMDYRLSDPYLDPTDADLACYSERTIRLPDTYWCYQPGGPTPQAQPPPCLSNGYVTFGCLSAFAKISDAALDLWADILASVRRSRIVLNCPVGSARQRVQDHFAARGIGADRLEFVARQSWEDYVRTYQRIDISLDPFPYGGAITLCDSLWMGVPVVSLSGRTAVGRAGRSILSNIGLPELMARTPEEYVRLACDCDRLVQLRSTLRQRMLASPLCDAPRFARGVEAAYREMWKRWSCPK